jgi:hypothetical protein
MQVRMLSDQEESLNEGRTRQRFAAGGTYDVPEELGQAWLAAGVAVIPTATTTDILAAPGAAAATRHETYFEVAAPPNITTETIEE